MSWKPITPLPLSSSPSSYPPSSQPFALREFEGEPWIDRVFDWMATAPNVPPPHHIPFANLLQNTLDWIIDTEHQMYQPLEELRLPRILAAPYPPLPKPYIPILVPSESDITESSLEAQEEPTLPCFIETEINHEIVFVETCDPVLIRQMISSF